MRRRLIFDFLNFIIAFVLWLFGLGPFPGTNENEDNCNDFGRAPSGSDTIVARFVALGDTPYDEEVSYPYEGPEFICLRDTIIPGIVNNLKNDIDFVTHIGDFKRGGEAFAGVCDDGVFGSRQTLFGAFEAGDVDFVMVPGGK